MYISTLGNCILYSSLFIVLLCPFLGTRHEQTSSARWQHHHSCRHMSNWYSYLYRWWMMICFFICGVAHPWSSSNLHPWKFVLLLPSLLSYFSCHHWFSSCGFINVMKEGYESSSARCQHHHDGRHDNSRMWSMQRRLSLSGSYRWYGGWAFAIIIIRTMEKGNYRCCSKPLRHICCNRRSVLCCRWRLHWALGSFCLFTQRHHGSACCYSSIDTIVVLR